MSAQTYYKQISGVLAAIHDSQKDAIERAGEALAATIAAGNRAYLFGSGHSVIPVMTCFRATEASSDSSRSTIRA